MLIDKGMSPGEVVTLKLTSGEELIARLVEDSATYYRLSKPMVLSMTSKGIGMVPYLFTVDPDKEINLNKATVTVIINSDKQFSDQYMQGTTGIALG
jgi:hypothetical protein